AYCVAVSIIMVPFLYFVRNNILISVAIILVSVFTISSGLSPPGQGKSSYVKIIHKSDGLMGQIMIADDKKTQRRSLMINNISQSFMHIPSGRSPWKYVHRIALYASDKPAGSNVLICGIGGGSLINELLALGFNIDAVDIDPRMAEVAVKYFGMPANTAVHEDDARHYIRTCKKKYDIVILDMSAGENQPSNVYTVECFKEIQGLMNPDGVLFVHYQNVLEGEGSVAVKSIGKTMIESGLKVKLLNTDKIIDGKKENWTVHDEIMFYASLETPEFEVRGFDRRNTFADPFNFPKDEGIFIEGYEFSDGILLTDDNPVMDVLHIGALESTRQAALKKLIPILMKQNIEIL
ncbi:MAG TPA: methyltransferase domain-containing protein, partial [Flavobacteriales bacterium]|nr:methyltransferase domain-containing protein [Flavobacteriales bacterium]